MILVLETFVAAVLNAVLATAVWLRFSRKSAAWFFIGAIGLRTIIAIGHNLVLPRATSLVEVIALACVRWSALPLLSLVLLLFFISIYTPAWLTRARGLCIGAAYLALALVLVGDVLVRGQLLIGAGKQLGEVDPGDLNPHLVLFGLFNLGWIPTLLLVGATMIRQRVERRPLALVIVALLVALALSVITATLRPLGNASILFDVALTGSLAYLLLRRRVFETTREAIDQALESMAEGIAVLTAEGKVLYTNRPMAEHLHLHEGQVLTVSAAPVRAAAPPLAAEAASSSSAASTETPLPSSQPLSTGRPTLERIEHELLRGSLGRERTEICLDRSDRSLVVAASPVLDRDGALQGHLLLARDVTEARTYERELHRRNADLHQLLNDLQEGKRAEEKAHREKAEAEAANVAKSTFLANMSHELRTPLNAILGFVQLMERDRYLAGQHRDNIEVIGRSGQHLLRLINDILEMSKIEAGRVSLVENTFDLYRMLKSLEEMFSVQTEKKGLKLVFDRDFEVPRHVRGDEGKLRQVLINLLANAVKFTDRGRVKLRLTRATSGSGHPPLALRPAEQSNSSFPGPASYPKESATPERLSLRFTISDTGRGIAPEDQRRLFEAFTQAGDDRDSGGTGLGLSISREFVRLMGGEIQLQSELGEGSTFTFEIKLMTANPSEISGERRARVAIGLASGQSTYRVLVVDDRWENRNLLLKLLQLVGFEVRGAENGLEALEQWDTWEPHLIWMDMRMPVMDGYETTKRIKATVRGKTTVVIALTASAFEHDRAMVLAVGCDDFVRKPFRDAEIFEKMEAHLGVRFVYEDRGPVLAEGRSPEQMLDPDALSGLPGDLLAELRRGATELNTKAVQAIIEKIRGGDAALAEALGELVRGYRFDTILELTERAGEIL
jgi:signal transduction histidine kinase/DNA-binding NarL/FixJ family response regulator